MDYILADMDDMAEDLIDSFVDSIYESVDFNTISTDEFTQFVTAMDYMPMEYLEDIPASVVGFSLNRYTPGNVPDLQNL